MRERGLKMIDIYEDFANEIKSQHYKLGRYLLLGCEMIVGALVIFCVLAMEQGERKYIVYGIAALIGFACGTLCSCLHCQEYAISKENINIIGERYGLEYFSLKMYYSIVGKRLKKKACVCTIVVFGILLIVNLVHLIEKPIYVVCIIMILISAMLVSTLVVYLISKFVAVKRD